jgi:hypothetical protein
MFEDELIKIENRKKATKNFRLSVVALGLLFLSGLVYFTAIKSFSSPQNRLLSWLLVLLVYALALSSGVVGIMVFKSSIASLYTFRNYKNYIALGLSVFVLVFLANEILRRL